MGAIYQDWMEINNNVLADVRDVIDPYVDWVEVVQHKGTPSHMTFISVRGHLLNTYANCSGF